MSNFTLCYVIFNNSFLFSAEESLDEVKLFFGSKFLSVPKSVFQEDSIEVQEEKFSELLN